MLNSISFKNYKAFDEGNLEIKPITILLGANSVGKSSLMQLFLLLQQTALSEENYKAVLKLHGGNVSLGEGINLLRLKDPQKTLHFSLEFNDVSFGKKLSTELLKGLVNELIYSSSLISKLYKYKDFDKNTLFNLSRKFQVVEDNRAFIRALTLSEDENKFKDRNYVQGRFKDVYNKLSRKNIIEVAKEEFFNTYDYLLAISNSIQDENFKVDFDLVWSETVLAIKQISLLHHDKCIISLEFELNSNSKLIPKNIFSSFFSFDSAKSMKLLKSLQSILISPSTIFAFTNKDFIRKKGIYDIELFTFYIDQIFSSCSEVLSTYFKENKINYVSPLRAHPKRYYFLDKAKTNAYLDTLDGDAMAEILKEKSKLKDQVNDWLKKFHIKIDVSNLRDIIHKIIVNQDSFELEISDVGFGISQILPVIIQGFLSPIDSVTLIEQPEIHLHPKMQADLADLFIEIALGKSVKPDGPISTNKRLIIETHSEYLLKRLRRRISEGKIPADLVNIYVIDPQIMKKEIALDDTHVGNQNTEEKGAVIRKLSIQEKGDFEWPIDFYGGELLLDTTVFLKNQFSS
ncbi:MAG: AAA family ATPase [Ignavibacteria bacterium]|nr:AAA family ATPase [Ignavibacteria bacterium]